MEKKRLKDEEVVHKTRTIKPYKLAADSALTFYSSSTDRNTVSCMIHYVERHTENQLFRKSMEIPVNKT